MSRLAWDALSPEFGDFVLYVKVYPLPGKCLHLKWSLIRPGASPTCHLEMQGIINEYVAACLLDINWYFESTCGIRILSQSLDVEQFLPSLMVAVSVIKIYSLAAQFDICTPEGSELIVGEMYL